MSYLFRGKESDEEPKYLDTTILFWKNTKKFGIVFIPSKGQQTVRLFWRLLIFQQNLNLSNSSADSESFKCAGPWPQALIKKFFMCLAASDFWTKVKLVFVFWIFRLPHISFCKLSKRVFIWHFEIADICNFCTLLDYILHILVIKAQSALGNVH